MMFASGSRSTRDGAGKKSIDSRGCPLSQAVLLRNYISNGILQME